MSDNTPDAAMQSQRDIARDAAAIKAGQQGLLFGEGAMDTLPEVGYRGPIAAGVVGITYRQLDYWARTGLVAPTVRPATGSGTARLYGFRDIVYECTSPDEVIDLLAGGQGVFGIAIGRVWQEVEGSLSQLPSDQSEYAVSDSDILSNSSDELSVRRRARVAGE